MGLFKRLLDAMSSLEKTAEVLAAEYDRLGTAIPESERLYCLLARRGGWKRLPEPFLRELASRLAKAAQTEGGGLHYVTKLALFVCLDLRTRPP